MNDILDIEIILKRQKYPFIYNIGFILIIILIVFLYISCVYKYQSYYITKGTIKDNTLELLVNLDDIKYISNQNKLTIDDRLYNYNIKSISENLYVDESLNNYKYIYLEIPNLSNINNYVYEVKLQKENKKIIEYLKDYL